MTDEQAKEIIERLRKRRDYLYDVRNDSEFQSIVGQINASIEEVGIAIKIVKEVMGDSNI